MRKLNELNIIDSLNEAVMLKRKPILGICLGMQVMAKNSEEGDVSGLGWMDAQTLRFDLADQPRYKVPHMGWNQITVKKHSPLMTGIDEEAEFYFAHSYHLSVNDQTDVLSETEYGIAFPSAVEKDNIFAVQFHPEKSHDAGIRLLKNFVEL